MSIITRMSGTKVPPHKVIGVHQSQKRIAYSAFVKKNGVKEQVLTPIPANMLIMYDSFGDIPSDAEIADGTNGNPDLHDRYLRLTGSTDPADILQYQGSAAHNGVDHGNAVQEVNVRSNLYGWSKRRTLGASGYLLKETDHGHNAPYHSHGGTADHTQRAQGLVPTLHGSIAGKGSVWISMVNFSDIVSLLIEQWYALEEGRFVYFDAYTDGVPLRGGDLHGHNTASPKTATDTATRYQESYLRDLFLTYAHNHYYDTAMPTFVNDNALRTLASAFRLSTDIRYLESLPSGTLGLFTTGDVPSMFTPIAETNGGLVKLRTDYWGEDIGTQSGSTVHRHRSTSDSSSWRGADVNSLVETQSGDEYYNQSRSYHSTTIDHTHSDYLNIMPPNISLLAAVKD